MDFTALLHDIVGRGNLQIRKLPLPKASPAIRKLASAILMLCVSFGLANWAQNLSREDALQDWNHAHGPESRIWESTLLSYQLKPQKDTNSASRWIRTLPANVDSGLAVWISTESDSVAVFAGNPSGELPTIYAESSKAPRTSTHWDFLGNGWEGFEGALKRLEIKAKTQKKVASRPNLPKDPRLLSY